VKRAALVAGAAACLVLAILATILAVDTWRWRDALESDDSRFRASPRAADWRSSALVPFGGTRSLLDIDDDVAFRKALRALRLAKLEEAQTSDTQVLLHRAEAEARLQALVEDGGGDAARRSRALALLAVLLLSTPVPDADEQLAALRAATGHLREAIALDPSNDEAKFNLEFILRRGRGGSAATGTPAPASNNPGSSRGAATSPPGTGY
jgi:hypothetical protein